MPTSRVILVLYAFTATTNVMASATGQASLGWATKPLLMPLLAGLVVFAAQEAGRRPSRLLIAGLLSATAGDVALMIDTVPAAFYLGVGAFAVCHACYIAAFVRAGAWRRLRRPPQVGVPIGYAVAVTAAAVWLYPLPVPVLGYAAVLTLMAATATGLGAAIGVGAALFLVSDLLIGVGLSGTVQVPGPPVWVMLTYTVGQALIAVGWATRAARTPRTATVAAQPTPAPTIPHPRPEDSLSRDLGHTRAD